MKKLLAILTILFLLSSIFTFNVFAETKAPINKRKIAKLIQRNIENFYIPMFYVGERSWDKRKNQDQVWKNTLKTGKKCEDLGLIKFEVLNETSTRIKYRVTLTEAGKNTPHKVQKMYPSSRSEKLFFVVSSRKLDEIVRIKMEEDILYVYFTYSIIDNDLGKKILKRSKFKCKGIAKIEYDVFTKKYFFKGLKSGYIDDDELRGSSWPNEEGRIIIGMPE